MHTSFDDAHMGDLVTLLKSHKKEFLSGQQISTTLGLSRTAVWKNVKKLESLGYKIDSKKNSGYKLVSKTDLFLPWEISDGLKTEIIGNKIYYFDTLDSTQNFAIRLARKPHENGSIVIARTQTSGRGRLNRKWISPKGGIWLSVVLRPDFDISHVSLFSLAVSLALTIAIEKKFKIKPQLKWPNDVTINNRKVAGILIDASIETNKIDYLVAGVGINFRVDPEQITRKIKKTSQHGVSTLVKKNQMSDPIDFIQEFLFQLEIIHKKMMSEKISEITREWTKRSSTLGKNVTVSTPTSTIKGKAISIDENGALLLSVKKKIHRIVAGDVTYSK